jgi:FdhD protein
VKKTARRYGAGKMEEKEVNVSEEELILLFVNKKPLTSLFASPRNLKELAVGFLASEGMIDYGNISHIDIRGCEIQVKTQNESKSIKKTDPAPVESKQSFRCEVILNSLKYLNHFSREWELTGGTHSACLINCGGGFLQGFEDISRHNAVDKVIGWALINNQRLEDKFILSTGRLSSVILEKTARVGIPLIVSNTAAFHRAIEIAEKLDIALVGFARHPNFTVYSNFWRITGR